MSRFHVRIMEKEGLFPYRSEFYKWYKVNGKLLAANEEIMLKEGDEVDCRRKSISGNRNRHNAAGGDKNRHGEGTVS